MSISTRFGLAGKRALTTGSGRGVGQATAVLRHRPASGSAEQAGWALGRELRGYPAGFPVFNLRFTNAGIVCRASAAVPSGGSAAYARSWGMAGQNFASTDLGAMALACLR